MSQSKHEIMSTAWSSISAGGLVAGTTATILQLLGMTGAWTAVVFVLILVFFSLTAFNVLLYRRSQAMRPSSAYIDGHDAVFDAMTVAITSARDSVWVTRFSRSSVDRSHEYFRVTERRIKGVNCPPVHNYRRLISASTADKASFVVDMLEQFSECRNFSLRSTNSEFFFELLIVDRAEAFMMFHDPGAANSVINSALHVTDGEVVAKLRAIYDAIWRDDAEAIKDEPVLSEGKRDRLLAHYRGLAESLPV